MTKQCDNNQWSGLEARLRDGAITRREFIGRATALGVTAALATTIATSAVAATPKKGGHMRLAMGHGSTTDTFDPAIIENGLQWVGMFALCNTITELAADGKLVPSLAESWESSPDAKVWRFKIRKGVEFHNGRTLTAKDIVGNLRYHTSEESKSVVKPILSSINEIKIDGGDTVVVSLDAGNADFPFNMNQANLCIMPATEDGKLDWTERVGSGGYRVTEYEPGVRTAFERFPNYWKEDRAHADTVELLTILDSSARNSALLSGAVDAIDRLDLKTAGRLAKSPGITVEESTGPLHYLWEFKTKTAPFDNVHVRQALKLSVDREEFLSKVLRGYGSLGNDSPIGPSYRYYAGDLEQNAYDPDKARWHLKQAGLDSLKVDLSAADAAFVGAVDGAVLFHESAAKAGIDINVVRVPNDGYWSNVWNVHPFVASYWGGYITEDAMFTQGYSTGAAWNSTEWDDEEFQTLLVAARAELNEDTRRSMYRDMQIILRDRGGAIVPAFANNVIARNDKIAHGEHVSPLKAFDGRRIIERWWMV